MEKVKIMQYKAPKETCNKLIYTADEPDQLKDISNSRMTYVNETMVRLITDNKPMSCRDAYIKQLDTIGLKKYVSCKDITIFVADLKTRLYGSEGRTAIKNLKEFK